MKFEDIPDTNSPEENKRADWIIHCPLWNHEKVTLIDIEKNGSYFRIVFDTRFGRKDRFIAKEDLGATFRTKDPKDIQQGAEYIVECHGNYAIFRRL